MEENKNIQKVIIREYQPHETIVNEGAANDRFFVILTGSVEILQKNKSIRLLKDGDVFGIENYYLNCPYTTTALSQSKSRIASYHISMIEDIIYDHPHLTHQILTSIVKQLEQTTCFAVKQIPFENVYDLREQLLQEDEETAGSVQPEAEPPPEHVRQPAGEAGKMTFHDDILCCFIEETSELIKDLHQTGESLKLVGIPNDTESKLLIDFAQKLNRLIGGTASMGFEQFTPLARKTSLIAARCAEIREMTIRTLISNMNLVVSVLGSCFKDLDSIKSVEDKIPALEQRLEICMESIGIDNPDIKTQEQIDEIFSNVKKSPPAE